MSEQWWIPVSERLPEKKGKYLCCVRFEERTRNGVVTRSYHRRHLCLNFKDGMFWINKGTPVGMISHWMPLVALPPDSYGAEVRGIREAEEAT